MPAGNVLARPEVSKGSQEKGAQEKRIRLSLDVSPELYSLLEKTAARIGGSKSDALRKAIILLDIVVDAHEKGKIFGVANSDEEPISKQIVGLF